jgi:hypothetical protein
MHGVRCPVAQIIIGWQKNLALGGGGGGDSRPWSPTGMLLDPNLDCGWAGGGGDGGGRGGNREQYQGRKILLFTYSRAQGR